MTGSPLRRTTGDPERDKRLQKWLKLADYLDDQGRDPLGDVEYRPPFGERYYRMDVSCHLHVRYRDAIGNFDPHDFCAEFHPLSRIDQVRRLLPRYCSQEHGRAAERVWRDHYWCQQSVLVRIREVAQHAERAELRAPDCETLCDGMVWLKPLNDCHVIWMNFREPPSSLSRELARRIYDGELNQILVSDLAAGVPDSELKCQVIERTPEVMEDIAEHQADTREVRAQVRHMADVQDVLSGFRVVLNSESWEIRFDRERLAAVLIEGVDVFLTALNLGPTSA